MDTKPTTLTTHILAALALGDSTPAQIREQIGQDSRSAFIPSESTFYKALHRMTSEGLIAHPQNTYETANYALTTLGRKTLKNEHSRISSLAQVMHNRLL